MATEKFVLIAGTFGAALENDEIPETLYGTTPDGANFRAHSSYLGAAIAEVDMLAINEGVVIIPPTPGAGGRYSVAY